MYDIFFFFFSTISQTLLVLDKWKRKIRARSLEGRGVERILVQPVLISNGVSVDNCFEIVSFGAMVKTNLRFSCGLTTILLFE